MTTIEALKNRKECLEYLMKLGPKASKENKEAIAISIAALEEKLAREELERNKPHWMPVPKLPV